MSEKKMIKWIISRVTMVKLGKSFWDKVAQKPVYYWRDCYFDVYMASSRWGLRVKMNNL